MASISLQQLKIVEDQLLQIQDAITNLELWNVVRNDLPPLRKAVQFFIENLYSIVKLNEK